MEPNFSRHIFTTVFRAKGMYDREYQSDAKNWTSTKVTNRVSLRMFSMLTKQRTRTRTRLARNTMVVTFLVSSNMLASCRCGSTRKSEARSEHRFPRL